MTRIDSVFLVDQHPVVRRGLRVLLEHDPAIRVVGEAGSACAAENAIAGIRPHVVIVDLMEPPRPGIAFIRRVKQLAEVPAVLVVTGEPVEHVLLRALEAGADGFVNKNGSGSDYAEAVHRVARRQPHLCSCAQRELIQVVFDRRRTRDRCLLESLTDEERELLFATVCGYNNHEIAEEMQLQVATVERLKALTREKLHMHRREDLVAFALRVDLLHTESRYRWIAEQGGPLCADRERSSKPFDVSNQTSVLPTQCH